MEEEEKNRTSYLRLAREAVRKRREKIAIQDAKDDDYHYSSSSSVEDKQKSGGEEDVLNWLRNKSGDVCGSDGDEREMYAKMQRLIEKNASAITAEVHTIQHNSNLLRKRIAGYTQLLNPDQDDKNTTVTSQ